MSEDLSTPLSDKAKILAELWTNYKKSDGFADFMSYNDLGLPLAYALSHGIIENNVLVESYISETFDVFLEALDVEDSGFESLAELWEVSGRDMG